MGIEANRQMVKQITWAVPRTGTLEVVHLDNGAIRWNVRISDGGRKPFISRWFNDPVPASDFLEKFISSDADEMAFMRGG